VSRGIFLIHNNGQLVELREQAYDSEALLQELLANYPNLLAGDQIDPVQPRRWLLIAREAGVPGEQGGGVAGPSIICSWIRMRSPLLSKSNAATTPVSAARW